MIKLKESEFQARPETEDVTLDALADAEVVNPARANIEVALTQLRGVGNDRSNTEGARQSRRAPPVRLHRR
jgi:hypothetical protein